MAEQGNNTIPEPTSKLEIPAELPVLPLRDTVVFPFVATPLIVARKPSVQLIDDVLSGDRLLALVAQRRPELEEPKPEDIHTVGTAAIVLKMLKFPDGSLRVLVQGIERIRVLEYVASEPYYRARIKVLRESYRPSTKIEALMRNVQIQFQKVVSLVPHLPDELQVVAMNLQDPGRLADLVASNINLNLQEKQEILELADVERRLERLTVFLTRELEVLELGSKIQSQVQSELGKNQREYFLREQLKAIQQELGIGDERSAEINELRKAIEDAKMPEQAYKEAMRELDRLAKMQPGAAEYTVSRTYLDWLVSLPW